MVKQLKSFSGDLPLMIVTGITMLIAICLALTISMILPKYLTDSGNYVYESSDWTKMRQQCKCPEEGRKGRYSSNRLDVPYTPSEDDSPESGLSRRLKTPKPALRAGSGTRRGDARGRDYDYQDDYARDRRSIYGPDWNGSLQGSTRNCPYLVSLSMPTYHPDESLSSRVFACLGIIISKEYVLTGANCVKQKSEFSQLMVRSGSLYWSQFGMIHLITKVVNTPMADLVMLKVSPVFQWDVFVKPMNFFTPEKWMSDISINWSVRIYLEKADQHRYKELRITSFTSNSFPTNHTIEYETCKKFEHNDCCKIDTSHFLVSFGRTLIGFKAHECDFFVKPSQKFVEFILAVTHKGSRISSNAIMGRSHQA